jgi:predicted DNA-binding transcriptional regulator AlpA
MPKRFLRLKQIIGTRSCPGRVPVSKSSWWGGVKSGRFPKPIKLGPRTTVWAEEDIDALGQDEDGGTR